MTTPFEDELQAARAELDAAYEQWNAMIDRLSANTGDDDPVECNRVLQSAWARMTRAEIRLDTLEQLERVAQHVQAKIEAEMAEAFGEATERLKGATQRTKERTELIEDFRRLLTEEPAPGEGT